MIHLLCDTETTGLLLPASAGLEKQPRIIELCLVLVERGEVVEEHNWLVDPEVPITTEITKITGIKPEDLEGKPKFSELVETIRPIFAKASTFIAHNAPFDKTMVANDVERAGASADFPWPATTLCTVQEFRHEFGRRMKLTELYQRKVGKPLAQTHRALDDVKALHEALVASNFYEALDDSSQDSV